MQQAMAESLLFSALVKCSKRQGLLKMMQEINVCCNKKALSDGMMLQIRR
jgi:hypothetical protein